MVRCMGVMVTLLVVIVTSPAALAGDGNVPPSTLAALGLGGMDQVSDAEGMHVRGKLVFASARGTSLIFGQLMDPTVNPPTPTSFVARSDVDTDSDSATAPSGTVSVTIFHLATLNFSLTTPNFSGSIVGFAGGIGFASATSP